MTLKQNKQIYKMIHRAHKQILLNSITKSIVIICSPY